ncbi:MAG: hypothetical protein RLZZ618_150 [Pseudomonadota bacterium]|jgi:SagB-type dehydrogenase family enzyme
MDTHAPLFELFWHNSKLNPHTAQQLERRILVDAASYHPPAWRAQPDVDIQLDDADTDQLNRRWPRASQRAFAERSFGRHDLSQLFEGFRSHETHHRGLASGGGKYPVDLFGMAFQVDGEDEGRVLGYHPEAHAFTRLGMAPAWHDCADMLGRGIEGRPALAVVLTVSSERSTVKYGERGGRFALIEVGMHVQNLLLCMAQAGMVGLPYAAYHDDTVRHWLLPDEPGARVALVVLCGWAPG